MMQKIWLLAVMACAPAFAQGRNAEALKATEAMAKSVMAAWPLGAVATTKNPGAWGYEEGVLLDGLAAEWHQTGDRNEFSYIQKAVDKYVTKDGTIQMNATGKPFATEEHQLDNIELGRAILLVYRETKQEKYAKAAKFLHDQLELQPRAASGGYWHKQIYPNQMWLDGAYMAEPFRAEYAATFKEPAEFDDIAKQFVLMFEHMRDPASGLLRHGWDESKAMPWADKQTGLSPEVWARALGWYCVALVDVLDWIPQGNPNRAKLIAVLRDEMASVLRVQDAETGLWWQVMDKGPQVTGTIGASGKMKYKVDRSAQTGNYLEASASAMFVYATAKGVRKGYLPAHYAADARRGWESLQRKFVVNDADGKATLTGTVKVGGLGGTPYRSGTFEYYVSEKTGDNDAKGVGAYLMAGSEMEQVRPSKR
jgi:unsaturated rhamnogalacturonyl hydrolase